MLEQFLRGPYIQREHFCHVVAAESNAECLRGVTRAVTQGARYKNIGKELHLHFLLPQAGAAGATALSTVKGEITGLQASGNGGGLGAVQLAYILEHAHVDRGSGARGADDGALVHQQHIRHLLRALDAADLTALFVIYFIGMQRAV